MAAGRARRAILERLQQVMRATRGSTSPFYRRKWDEAGFHPDHLQIARGLRAKVPVITKEDLRAAQARTPPFGDYLCVARQRGLPHPRHVGHHRPPDGVRIGRGDWSAIANAHARIMWGMGIRPGDTVFIAAIFSLYMGSWGALAGAERLGAARRFPFGAGAPGMTARAAMWLDQMKPHGVLRHAVVRAAPRRGRAQTKASTRATSACKTLFFSGEPGASVPGVRDRIDDAVRRAA